MSRSGRRSRSPSLDLLAAAGMVLGGIAVARAARRRRRIDFAGKVAVITGGSRGLGLVLARELVRNGARVAITPLADIPPADVITALLAVWKNQTKR